jgi:hypothetical protein
MIERTHKTERTLLRSLEADPLLATRAERFHSVKQVISYCGPVQRRDDLGRQFQTHAHLQTAQSSTPGKGSSLIRASERLC